MQEILMKVEGSVLKKKLVSSENIQGYALNYREHQVIVP